MLVAACGGSEIRVVTLPTAAILGEPQKSWILKAYRGMTMNVDGVTDSDKENFVRYAAAAGEHTIEVTVYRLIDDTGYNYHGAPMHWNGTITTKAGLYYEISAEPNTATDGIDIRLTGHVRPLVDYDENRVIGHAAL